MYIGSNALFEIYHVLVPTYWGLICICAIQAAFCISDRYKYRCKYRYNYKYKYRQQIPSQLGPTQDILWLHPCTCTDYQKHVCE